MKSCVAILALGVALTGCSSKSSSAPKPPANLPSYLINGGVITGFHGSVAKKTTTSRFSLIPLVYAQTTTVTLTGSYSGYGVYYGLSGGPVAFPVYGVGTLLPICLNQVSNVWNGPCPSATSSGSLDPGQALASQAVSAPLLGAFFPAAVTGDGTLGPLVVYAVVQNSATSSTSDPVEVWVFRNGQVLNSGISCSLTIQPSSAPALQRCESASTFSVQDLDGIFATVTLNATDIIGNMNFLLVKD